MIQDRYPHPSRDQLSALPCNRNPGINDGPLGQTFPGKYLIEINQLLVPFGKHIYTGLEPKPEPHAVDPYAAA